MDRIRVLWVSDAVAATGFARVAHSVLDHLVQDDLFDIHVLGINYFGDPHSYDYDIYPAAAYGGSVTGLGRLLPLIEGLSPDVVVLLNDIWVVAEYLEAIPENIPVITYSPVDGDCIQPVWLKSLYERASLVCVYTQFGYNVVKRAYPLLEPLIVPHGIDKTMFFPIDINEARSQLNNVDKDEWIVLNANRNQPRKKIDSTMRAFAGFARGKPKNVKLYLHMGLRDVGWNLVDLWRRLDIEERIIITHPSFGPQNPVSNEMLNYIYNSCNVGINTSLGEGWGLPSFEHAATNHIQLVPNSSACEELFKGGRGLLIDVFDQPFTHTNGINTNGRAVIEKSAVQQLQYAYDHPEECAEISQRMYDYIQQPEFEWSNIAKIFASSITSVVE